MAAKAVAVVPATLQEIATASDMMSHHAEALKALKAAQTEAEFTAAWEAARAAFAGETAAIEGAVAVAKETVRVGQAAIDAHTTYRLRLVEAYTSRYPKVTNAALARAVYGDDSNTRRKQVGRDRIAVTVRIVAAKAKDAHPDMAIAVPTFTQALKAANAATSADAQKALLARAAKGEDLIVKGAQEVKPLAMSRLIVRAESVKDGLALLDQKTVTAETLATLRTLAAEISAAVDSITVEVAATAGTATK